MIDVWLDLLILLEPVESLFLQHSDRVQHSKVKYVEVVNNTSWQSQEHITGKESLTKEILIPTIISLQSIWSQLSTCAYTQIRKIKGTEWLQRHNSPTAEPRGSNKKELKHQTVELHEC